MLRVFQALAEKPDGEQPQQELERALRDVAVTINLRHVCEGAAEPVSFPFKSESSGTRALLALSGPVLQSLRSGFTLLVDEIDTSLHPRLVAEIIRLFQNPETNPKNAQIIFSSHDTSLLGNLVADKPILERDQVWFVTKDRTGASSVYALTDFSPRRLENLERGYLQGRYGAIPFLDHEELRPVLQVLESDR